MAAVSVPMTAIWPKTTHAYLVIWLLTSTPAARNARNVYPALATTPTPKNAGMSPLMPRYTMPLLAYALAPPIGLS